MAFCAHFTESGGFTETISLTGPAFLQNPHSSHVTEEAPSDLVHVVEVRAYVTTSTKASMTLGSHCFEIFSSWKTLVGGTAYFMHIVQSVKKKRLVRDGITRD